MTRAKRGIGVDLRVSVPEVQQATGLSSEELREYVSILDSYGFIFDNGVSDFDVKMVGISTLQSGWPVWTDLREFCNKEGLNLSQIICNLHFSVLDN